MFSCVQSHLWFFLGPSLLGHPLTKSHRGRGFSLVTINMSPGYFHKKNKRKIEPKVLPSCTIPLLLFAYTRQLEILAIAVGTTWIEISPCKLYVKLFCLLGSFSLHETTPMYIVSRILLSQVHSVLKSLFSSF